MTSLSWFCHAVAFVLTKACALTVAVACMWGAQVRADVREYWENNGVVSTPAATGVLPQTQDPLDNEFLPPQVRMQLSQQRNRSAGASTAAGRGGNQQRRRGGGRRQGTSRAARIRDPQPSQGHVPPARPPCEPPAAEDTLRELGMVGSLSLAEIHGLKLARHGGARPTGSGGLVAADAIYSDPEEGCGVCFEEYANEGWQRAVRLACGHLYCLKCIYTHIDIARKKRTEDTYPRCPTCRGHFWK